MSGIYPRIVEHEINTYPNARHVQQCLRVMNPHKSPSIKEEIEKFLKVGFNYPFPLAEWVSKLVLVGKK